MIATKGYCTSLARKTLATLIASQKLQIGEGVDGILLAPTRRRDRLIGQGRVKGQRVGVKLEKVGDDYEPRKDSCVAAFVRLRMAQMALESTASDATA